MAVLAIQTGVAFLLPPSALGLPETTPKVALSGHVSSQDEGAMEGVLVTAKRDGARMAITVVSDAQGQYSFPRARLEDGHYALKIRAVGYDLGEAATVDVMAQKPAQMDLKLVKAKDIASQLTNAEWLMSVPGTPEQRKGLLACTGCHTYERIFRSHYDAAGLVKVASRMVRYAEGSTPDFPQVMPAGMPGRVGLQGLSPEEAAFVASVNLSAHTQWEYPLKTFPRPKGESDKVIITEYDLPRKFVMPHDTAVDGKGNAWYCDDAHQFIGRLNLKTADVKEFPIPTAKPDSTKGCRDIYLDKAGDPWIATQGQGGVAKFDVKTEKFQVWQTPPEIDPDGNINVIGDLPQNVDVDHKLWVLSTGKIGKTIQRLDVETGKWEAPIYVFKDIPKDNPAASRPQSIYAIFSDSQNNCYFSDYASEFIGKIDAKTKAITFYQTPTFNSAPRRGEMDSQDRLWFGEFLGNRIGMFDTKTAKFQEWETPTPFAAPYDAMLDKEGYAWTGSMFTDRAVRVNTKTNKLVEYMLPRDTNIRRVAVDNTTNPPSLVVGNTHGYTIVRIEPLDLP
jgi:virginiamycin B lyase